MHPEHVQVAGPVEGYVEERNLIKPQEALDDDIDVVEVDNGDLISGANGGGKDELNGNGFLLKENGHIHEVVVETTVEKDLVDLNPSNGADLKSATRIRSSRRNSTSSRSSSVSSAPSLKHQAPMALQMEVSMDDEERDMEPLIMEGNAEDLEVSGSVSHEDLDDGATTDSETILEAARDPYDFEGDSEKEEEILSKRTKSSKSSRGMKNVKASPKTKLEGKVTKPKTPRTKSLKLKSSKASLKVYDELDMDYSDTNSLSKDDTESEDLNIKPLKSPSKRVKSTQSKQDLLDEAEVEEKVSETDHAPRRSSRSRQTPQKYNSSLYVESLWENQLQGDDRTNTSDAAYGASIRSVKGRRSLRKSRNISALNTSLHNESSPWDNEFKVLTPCGGGLSLHNDSVAENVGGTTPLKRKASDEDDDIEELNERGQKKMCVENAALDNSYSSLTSSFFSVITSPIVKLKNKLRGSSISCSTPIKDNASPLTEESKEPQQSEIAAETAAETENDIESPAAEELATAETPVETAAVENAPEARSWCAIM